jgi:hypothetical protein
VLYDGCGDAGRVVDEIKEKVNGSRRECPLYTREVAH